MEDIRIDGLTADEWEALANPNMSNNQELEALGIIQQGDNSEETTPKLYKRDDYEQLGYWETIGDEALAGVTELSKFFMPKKAELNYTPRTKAGEAFQTYTKYLWGLAGLAAGGAEAGALKGTTALANAPKAQKVLSGVSKALGGDKFFKTGSANFFKKAGVGTLNALTQGSVQGAIIDWVCTDPYDERLVDMLPETDNAFIEWLKTDPNDSVIKAKFKNVVEGVGVGTIINGAGQIIAPVAKPLIEKIANNIKFIRNSKVPEEQVKAAEELIETQKKLDIIEDKKELAEQVRLINEEANETGQDAYQLLVDRLAPENIEEGEQFLALYKDGNLPFIHEDGTWDIKIEKYEDAYKVSEDEFTRQLKETAPDGDLAIDYMDKTVHDIWLERQWIGTNEELNSKTANKIVKNYQDKWQIDNNIKVEFVDGLVDKNKKPIEGTTEATSYLGKKTPKSKSDAAQIVQNKLDRKILEIKELEAKLETTDAKITSKNAKKELTNFKKELTKFTTIKRSYKNKNWTQNVSDPVTRGYRKVEETWNEFITEIKKTPTQETFDKWANKIDDVLKYLPEDDIASKSEYLDNWSKIEEIIQQIEATSTAGGLNQLEKLKEQLRIAKNEAVMFQREIKDINNRLANITIKIDTNAKNPYATLRSELEHARDIAKGTVPEKADIEGSGVHFSRYKGDNEGEMAGRYVHKKVSTRANKPVTEEAIKLSDEPDITISPEDIPPELNDVNIEIPENILQQLDEVGDLTSDIEKQGYKYTEEVTEFDGNVISLKNKNDEDLGYLSYSETEDVISIDYMYSEQKEKGIANKLVLKLIEEKPTKLINWDCVTPESEAAKNKFINEHPELSDRIKGLNYEEVKKQQQIDEGIDLVNKNSYTDMQEGVINEGKDNSQINKGIFQGTEENTSNYQDTLRQNELREPSGNSSRELPSDSLPTNERGETPSYSAIQEAKSIDDLTKVELQTTEDLAQTLDKAIELDPEISGFTWKAIANDAEKQAEILEQAEACGLYNDLQAALTLKDVDVIDNITRKVLAAQKLSSQLMEKLNTLGYDAPTEQIAPIIDMIDQISKYTKATGSASGRNLQARKFINRAVATFGSLRLSKLTRDGISTLADLLDVEIKKLHNLNFTRGHKPTNQELKEQLYSELFNGDDSEFMNVLFNDSELSKEFDNILTKLIAEGNVSAYKIEKAMTEVITRARYEEVYNAIKLADKPETKLEIIRKWCDKQGGLTSYYVHNLLSNVGTLSKNIISGGMNTAYFPMKKILAGFIGGGAETTREGINQFKALSTNWTESWELCKQAFLKGEGKISNVRDTLGLAEEEIFSGYREFDFSDTSPEGIWHSIQNFHSLMTRAMGASDELLSQLNYRSIMRAKAIEAADVWAKANNIKDEKLINLFIDKKFKASFDSAGRPTDIEALTEARDILYQLPLNGKMMNNATGEMEQVRDKTWVTGIADSLNQSAAKHPLIKVIFPFVKTGANILQMNLEHNGIYAILSAKQRKLLFSQTKEGAIARSQVAMGCFSLAIGGLMAASGIVTGSPPLDTKERKALFATGWKPYSFRVGNKYVSYQGYEPIQTILGFAADSLTMYNTITDDDFEGQAKIEKFKSQMLGTLINNFIDKAAFRTGLRQLALITDPTNNAEDALKALSQTAQGFLPFTAAVRNTSSIGNRSNTQPNNIVQRMFNNYFNRGLGDYRRDCFGNRQDTFGLLISNTSEDFSDLPEYAELERLAEYGFNPTEITKVITGTTLQYTKFTNPETNRTFYDAVQEELSTITIDGNTLQEAVRELVTSEDYQYLPEGINMNGLRYTDSDDTKLNAIRDIFREYNSAALNSALEKYSDIFVDRDGKTVNEKRLEISNQKEAEGFEPLTDLY